MQRIVEYPATNGSAEILTKQGKTTISFCTDGQHMFIVMDNNAQTRRFLRTALRRMEREYQQAKGAE